ncbi:efflux RND transporter periplasmic adaptor subunit [Sphingomonas sp. H39-1-10]|uniref:HlyD family secretion protein n=1 Tax=Sphingomonas TaxID=13687 RepID=UPI000887A51A|nr:MULTISPECIES: HlyD family efflux transporter periplasmic adaptor subunit [Sphingomonas]MDF0488075.1 efflux RND transporter periplasmic adaptor subunit [Sphingomonas pollutisoli]SDA33298.1 HlyD family secretion protein [Sphingomonas sp. NFR15]
MNKQMRTWAIRLAIAAVIVAALLIARIYLTRDRLGEGIAAGNGRIEATEVDISAKAPGRIRTILAEEGQEVKAGQILATVDVDSLEAQRAQAQAQTLAAQTAVQSAQAQVAQALGQRGAALAQLFARETDLDTARQHLRRSTTLAAEGATPQQEQDDDRARLRSASAGTDAARAQLAAIDAAVATARAQVNGARANAEAARATIRRIDADIGDAVLRAPRSGRIQYRIAEPGEVVGAGGKVLNMIDLSDVYLTFFLPEQAVGKVGLGDEARIVLDSAPGRVIPARISFVADVAQFTPKTVETRDERQKLMFRVRASIAPELLARFHNLVKSGMPGMAYVRIDPAKPWPAKLALTPAK